MFRSWKDLPPGERLRLAYLPLLVAACAALFALVLDKGAAVFDSHGAHLEVVDEVVANGRTENERGKPHVEVKLHNTGDRRSILTHLRTRVYRSAVFPACLLFGGEGTYETGRYSIVLPQRTRPGFSRETVLNEELGPDQTDRFRATFETRGTSFGMVALHELSLAVVASNGEAVSLGRFLAMTPFSLSGWNSTSWFADGKQQEQLEAQGAGGPALLPGIDLHTPGECYRRNRKTIAPFLRSHARRSGALSAFLDSLRGPER